MSRNINMETMATVNAENNKEVNTMGISTNNNNMKEETIMGNSTEDSKEAIIMSNNTTNGEVQCMNSATENNNKEAEIMTGKNNRSTGTRPLTADIAAQNEISYRNVLSNISEIIPAEEMAVSEKEHQESVEPLVVVKTIELWGGVIPEIPEDERSATDEKTYIDLKEPAKYGCFSPAVGMRGFEVNTGHVFYAQIFTDSKGNRWVKYCQQYKDGSFSPKMQIKQSELVIGASALCNENNKKLKFMSKNAVNKIIANARNDYYNKTAFPQECVSIEQIFVLLLCVYKSLPAEGDVLEAYDCPENLYAEVMAAIRKEPAWFENSPHKAYYALDAEQIEQIAQTLNMKRDLLLKKLKEYRFLYLTDSSKGYQTCVRFPAGKSEVEKEFFPKSYTQWSYCVLKLEYLASQLAKREQG